MILNQFSQPQHIRSDAASTCRTCQLRPYTEGGSSSLSQGQSRPSSEHFDEMAVIASVHMDAALEPFVGGWLCADDIAFCLPSFLFLR